MEKVAGPRREAFTKRGRTNVAIKTKPTAFVQRRFSPPTPSSSSRSPRDRGAAAHAAGAVYAARNRGGGVDPRGRTFFRG